MFSSQHETCLNSVDTATYAPHAALHHLVAAILYRGMHDSPDSRRQITTSTGVQLIQTLVKASSQVSTDSGMSLEGQCSAAKSLQRLGRVRPPAVMVVRLKGEQLFVVNSRTHRQRAVQEPSELWTQLLLTEVAILENRLLDVLDNLSIASQVGAVGHACVAWLAPLSCLFFHPSR